MKNPKASSGATDVSAFCKSLGLHEAPLVVDGVEKTIAFFRFDLQEDPWKWLSYIRGIDFHRKVVRLKGFPAGTLLSRHKAFRGSRKPFIYLTKPGTSPLQTGTNFGFAKFELYRVSGSIPALQSSAASLHFDPEDRVVRPGGGIQYILPTKRIKGRVLFSEHVEKIHAQSANTGFYGRR